MQWPSVCKLDTGLVGLQRGREHGGAWWKMKPEKGKIELHRTSEASLRSFVFSLRKMGND